MTRQTPDTRLSAADTGPRPASVVSLPAEERHAQPIVAWSFPPRRILVPVDFGHASAQAVALAGALVARFGAALEALHADIIEAPVYFTHEQARAIERDRNGARSLVERELKEFVRHATLERARVRFVEESPATAIIEASRAADLIVMGTHGRRGPSRWWLGSVAERIVREADRPVLVVRAASESRSPELTFRRPLMVASPLAFDGNAARYATGLAEAFGGTVAPQAASCERDLAREREATLLVVAGTSAVRTGRFSTPAEKLIRSCALPMLFVPA